MLPDKPTLQQLKSTFENDRFATQAAGCRIVSGERGHAVCEMALTDMHNNAMGSVMGGAIFTLADFALAIACNVGEEPTVGINSSISFMRSTKGTKLIATATCEKPGSHVAFYAITVEDDWGKTIAQLSATCYR